MTEPPSRKRFQLHLSTAIVLMLVSSTLLYANMTPEYTDVVGVKFYGWPLRALFVLNNFPEKIYYKRLAIDMWFAFTNMYFAYGLCDWSHRAGGREQFGRDGCQGAEPFLLLAVGLTQNH